MTAFQFVAFMQFKPNGVLKLNKKILLQKLFALMSFMLHNKASLK